MTSQPYPIDQLAADLRRIAAESSDEKDILRRVRPLAVRAAMSKDLWLKEEMLKPDAEQGFSLFPLHEEPDHTLAVFAVSWLPRRGTPPHDHGTWAVVAGVQGPEKNTFWERLDDGSRPEYAELKQIGEKIFDCGEVMAMPRGSIHKVWNESDNVTVSLHIYGKHINHTGRSQFDPEKRTASRYISKIEGGV